MDMISEFIPNEVFDSKIETTVLRKVVELILQGGNIRDLTEERTRRRILLTNVALVFMYFKMLANTPSLEDKLSEQIGKELSMSTKKVPYHNKEILLSLIGMTKKGWDNILRGEKGKKEFLEKLDKSLAEIENEIIQSYGKYEAEVRIGDQNIVFNARSLIRCIMAIGSQTLTIRGSEKSIYGKLFERLVLGSVLTLLGFNKIDKDDFSGTKMVFWLSDPRNKRECDATALITPGVCIRFDIGFIGRGNTEISLDKVSRYDRFLELKSKGKEYKMSSNTIVIVDTIGESSKAWQQAREIGGCIIQMNGSYWVKELSSAIKNICKEYVDPLEKKSQVDSLKFISEKMVSMNMDSFLPPTIKKTRTK